MHLLRMHSLWMVGVLVFLVGCGKSEPKSYDIIVVSIDTLRTDRLAMYGSGRDTDGDPNALGSLAWLASQGEVYETCWAPSGKTVPSLASFWTGQYPLEHGAISNKHWIIDEVRPRAEELRVKGYRCFAQVANRSLGRPTQPPAGLARGFEDYGFGSKDLDPQVGPRLVAKAREPIRNKDKLLLWAHYMAPHQPYTPLPRFADRYTQSTGRAADNSYLYELHQFPQQLRPEEKERIRALYDAEIYSANHFVQSFLSELDRLYKEAGRGPLLENAIVIFFSDHGEELADRHGYFLHAKSLYSGVIRVPLVIAGPNIPVRKRNLTPLDLTQVLDLVLDGTEPQEEHFVSAWQGEFFAVRDAQWTLVHNPCESEKGPREPPLSARYPYPTLGLYDRSRDPLEQRDIAVENPEVVRRLLAALNAWYDGLRMADAGVPDHLDPTALNELGYPESFEENECEPWRATSWNPQQ